MRINPYEIHINDIDFYDEIYPPAGRRRDVYDWSRKGLDAPLSLAGTVDHDVHHRRRMALNPFFSKASTNKLEPLIQSKIDELCDRLKRTPGVVNLGDAFTALTVNIIGRFAFGQDYGYLKREDFGSQWRYDLMNMMHGSKILAHFHFLLTLMKWLPQRWVASMAPAAMAEVIIYKQVSSNPVLLARSRYGSLINKNRKSGIRSKKYS